MTETKKLNLSAMSSKKEATSQWETVENTPKKPIAKPAWGVKINLSSIKSQSTAAPQVKISQPWVKNTVATEIEKTPEPQTLQEISQNEEKTTLETNTQNTQDKQKIQTINSYKENNHSIPDSKEVKKLQISALKKPLENSQTQETSKETQENISSQDVSKVETTEKKEKIETLKKPLEMPKVELNEDKLMEKIVQDNQNPKANPNEVFHNYESEYKQKQWHILDSIEKIKEIANIKKMSKTNKVFVTSIVWLTAVGIGFLFHINPDVSSLDKYKASILTLAGKQMTQEEIQQHEWNIQEEIAWKLEENNLGGYDLWFEILVGEDGSAVYKFDGSQYDSKELLDEAIQNKLEALKNNRIRQYFTQSQQDDIAEESASEIQESPENILVEEQEIFVDWDTTQSSPEQSEEELVKQDDITQENWENNDISSWMENEKNNSQEEQTQESWESSSRSMDILMKNYSQKQEVNPESDQETSPESTNNQIESQNENQAEATPQNTEFEEYEMYEEEFMFE